MKYMKFSELGVNVSFRFHGARAVWNKIDEARCIQLRSEKQESLPAIFPNRSSEVFLLY